MKIVKKIESIEYKNSKFDVELEYYFDEDLEEEFVDVELGNRNLRNIRNEYRRRNNLLLDYNIKQIREKYELSQKDFALLLGFGEVTITRYESKTVQDKAQDAIIREARNPEKFYDIALRNREKFINEYDVEKFEKILEGIKKHISTNYIELTYFKRNFSGEYVGEQELSLDKVFAIIKEFCNNIKKLTKTKLAKFLWYADFLSYKKTSKGITGLSYCHLPYGAAPFMYEEILDNDNICVETYFKGDSMTCLIKKCHSLYSLSEYELSIIDDIISKFKNMNTKEVVEYMHDETAFINTKNKEYISYLYANEISI